MKRYICPRCQGRKVRKSFGDNAARPDGRAVYCKTCKAEQSRKARAQSRRDYQAIARILRSPRFQTRRVPFRPERRNA